jgi:hypothetical protein
MLSSAFPSHIPHPPISLCPQQVHRGFVMGARLVVSAFMCRGPCLIGGHTLAGGGAPRTRVPYATGLRPLGTPFPSRPSYPCRYIWTGRTGVRPLPLRQGPEGLPCGLRTGGSALSPTSYTLFPLAGNSRPHRHLRLFSSPLGFHRGCPGGRGSTEERRSSLGLDTPLHLVPNIG